MRAIQDWKNHKPAEKLKLGDVLGVLAIPAIVILMALIYAVLHG